jgi:hypothetical protein
VRQGAGVVQCNGVTAGCTHDPLRAVIFQDTFLFWKAPLTVFARRIRRCRSGRLSSTRS